MRRTTLLTGMSREQLQAALNAAQLAYIELSTGAKGVSFSYTQGDGTRSVSYQQTSLGDLLALIQAIQTELGITARRPIRVRY
ncbi:gpW family head-tail joining protein [Xenorhabdus hominickii]|uniref:Phage head-tail adapter protein n=1 Tax=Xenorhabdus hominickii TaxID=351679 RepID=A0A2G0Q144_XENHO|nr:gpW family head-tail joining protein [Xenorhabdus hominickii]AOM40504.1 phage head-tail adapter protein [Xenorhabdus hominickii]PHM52926.1 phage head-tail adapter protein [Xenorhabdus hominickii]